jgi:hypothetical protein
MGGMVVEGRAGMVRVVEVFRGDSGTSLGEFCGGAAVWLGGPSGGWRTLPG